jgi:hypothetical protein
MKMLPAFAVLLMLGASAAAKLAPVEREQAAPDVGDNALYLGPIGAMLESDYFRVPRHAGGSRVFPCRFRLQVEAPGARVTQSCE